jgi:predicted acyltransferase
MSSTLRVGALDSLRGLAVLGMVLSGSIGFGGQLPGWMYHAQVPPPLHKYDAAKALLMPGITWVDLVFPAFLFAMGAAIPLAARSLAWSEAAWGVLRRAALLLCFALFTEHMKAAHLAAAPQPAWVHGVSLLSFLLLGLALTRIVPRWARLLAVVAALGLALALPFADGKGFRPQR